MRAGSRLLRNEIKQILRDENGKITQLELGRRLGLSQQTVHHHLKGMKQDKEIRLAAEQPRIHPLPYATPIYEVV